MKLQHWQRLNRVSDGTVAENIGRHATTVGKYHRGAIPDKEPMRKIFFFTGGIVQPNDFYDLVVKPEDLDYAFNAAMEELEEKKAKLGI